METDSRHPCLAECPDTAAAFGAAPAAGRGRGAGLAPAVETGGEGCRLRLEPTLFLTRVRGQFDLRLWVRETPEGCNLTGIFLPDLPTAAFALLAPPLLLRLAAGTGGPAFSWRSLCWGCVSFWRSPAWPPSSAGTGGCWRGWRRSAARG